MNTKKLIRLTGHQNYRTVPAGFIFILIIVCCFTIAANTTSAATYYVDDVNGNDNNTGNSTLPWKTLARAVEGYSGNPNVKAGDTIYVRNGTYVGVTFNYVPTTEPSSWTDVITYQAASGHSPKISSSTGAALTITGLYKRYLDFNDIDMEVMGSTKDAVVYIQQSGYIKIRNCSITGYIPVGIGGPPNDNADYLATTGCGIWSRGYTSTKNNDLQFDHLEITKVARGIQTTEYFGTGFKVTNCKIHNVSNSPIAIGYNGNPNHGEILIQGNEFYDEQAKWQNTDWSHGSIVGKNNYMTIRNNIIHSCGASSGIYFYELDSSDWGSIPSDIPTVGYANILIENNLIYDMISPLGLIRINYLGNGSVIVRNNTIIGSQNGSEGNIWDYYGGGSIYLQRVIADTNASGFRFDNNILVGCFTVPQTSGFTGFHAEGNIIFSVDDDLHIYTWSNSNTIIRYGYNYYPHTVDTNFITNFFANVDSQNYFRRGTDTTRYADGGPHRIDYTTNFKLHASSPAIGKGASAYASTTDINGTPRGATPDAGCYENAPAAQNVTSRSK
jgi:hypothetical protein